MRSRTSLAAVAAVALLSSAATAAGGENPFVDSQAPQEAAAEHTFEDADETVAVPAGAVDDPGGGPAVEYVVVPAFGPCINDQGEASNLAGVEMRPPGTFLGTFCIGDQGTEQAPVIDYAALQATAVTIAARVRPAAPALAVEPAGRALVNTPVVLSVADPGPAPSGSDTSGPFSIVVTLGQPTYTWSFDGGAFQEGGRGRPYDGGPVAREGRGTPYVSRTWTTTGTGRIAVRATWAASYRVRGPGIDQTFALQPVQQTTRTTVPVVQARAELVDR